MSGIKLVFAVFCDEDVHDFSDTVVLVTGFKASLLLNV